MTAAQDQSDAASGPFTKFLADLARPGNHPPLDGASATLRIEIPGLGHWYLTIDGPGITVTRDRGPADTVVTLSREAADGLAAGTINAQAALLRGLVTIEGQMAPALMFQRCLPGPPGSTGRVAPISGAEITARHAARGDRGDIPETLAERQQQ